MYKSLRNKLVLLYTISTGFILVVVMIILLIFMESKLEEKRIEAFKEHGDAIISKLQLENLITHSWLSHMEAKNNLIIHIEDNGNPLNFKGVLRIPSDRSQLLDQLNALALNEGINANLNPLNFYIIKSKVYKIKGSFNETYYGLVVILPTDDGWRSLSLLQYLPNLYSSILSQRILYSILALGGIFALFLISFLFVSKMLKPIEENKNRQTAFIAAASHELRSPLSVIMGNCAAISEVSGESENFLSGIIKECKRMARLINDMLQLACMDAKTWHIKKEPIEIDTLLIETYEAFLPLFGKKNISLELELQEEELPIIDGDKDRLKQVLSILLDNALSYTPSGKKVTLRGYVTTRHLNIEVEDQGIGISDPEKKLIFDRFYRVDKSRNDKEHFGLGLCIAQELIQLHGGKISVKDTYGGGATFVLRIRI